MKKILSLLLLILFVLSAYSQGQKKSVGIRGGLSSGFEYRVFVDEQTSYKALLSFRKQGIQLTGMKEFHIPGAFDFLPELTFIYGYGAHAGFESWNRVTYYVDTMLPDPYVERRSGPIAGLDCLAAVEYTIPQIPLTAGFEVKPYFNLFGRSFFQLQPFDFAFTVKYNF